MWLVVLTGGALLGSAALVGATKVPLGERSTASESVDTAATSAASVVASFTGPLDAQVEHGDKAAVHPPTPVRHMQVAATAAGDPGLASPIIGDPGEQARSVSFVDFLKGLDDPPLVLTAAIGLIALLRLRRRRFG